MSRFDVHSHIDNRMISYNLSRVIDETIGAAVRSVAEALEIDSRKTDYITITVTNAMHSSIDSAIDYHHRGRVFRGQDLCLNFFVKQVQDLLADYLDHHEEDFKFHLAEQLGADANRRLNAVWLNTRGRIASESIALLKSTLGPSIPRR
ncbi:MAG: hypothetical protein JNK76_07240 [Planctomycetales bacterium]|nr:hypothetical protein [Planctomycetales bacterium]